MKHLKIGLTVLLLASVPNVQAGEVSFRYGFIGKQGADAKNLVVIEEGATLHSGDPLKLNFEHSKGTWFYIYYRSTLDEYALLYSAKGRKSQQSKIAFGTLGWLTLDQHTGEETFMLIASNRQLRKLEKTFKKYEVATGESKKRFRKRIRALIEKLRGEHSTDSSVVLPKRLEQPVIAAVSFRAAKTPIRAKSLAYESLGDEVAVVTFVIQHH